MFLDQCACMCVDMCVFLRQSVGVFKGQWEVVGRCAHLCSTVLKYASYSLFLTVVNSSWDCTLKIACLA